MEPPARATPLPMHAGCRRRTPGNSRFFRRGKGRIAPKWGAQNGPAPKWHILEGALGSEWGIASAHEHQWMAPRVPGTPQAGPAEAAEGRREAALPPGA